MAILEEKSSRQASPGTEETQYKLFSAQADAASSDEISAWNAIAISLLVVSGTGVSGGTVVLEGAPISGYTGTWVQLGSLTINAASKVFGCSVAPGDESACPCTYVRARVASGGITGGTIAAYITIQR